MSYDLFFRLRQAEGNIDLEDVRTYFRGRTHYETSDSQATYHNSGTGVYFQFEFENSAADKTSDDTPIAPRLLPVSFCVNAFRPHVFGLEAAEELAEFIEHFDLTIYDDQAKGMGEGEFSKDGFLRGYNLLNEVAYKAIIDTVPECRNGVFLPTTTIESVWRWNYEREKLEEILAANMIVPHIHYLRLGTDIKTAIIWAGDYSAVVPEVDIIVIPRIKLRFLRRLTGKAKHAVLKTDDLKPLLTNIHQEWRVMPYYRIEYPNVPSSIPKLFKNAKPPDANVMEIIKSSSVLNKEILERAEQMHEL